ncbi:MAG: site-specific integrase [Gammaproteobacteria bacterium]|nr:MAG: site-specific integrase [Gammaproteobacteria bacterium]
MNDIDHYIKAGTRDNTRRAYQSAVHHFEVEWGGFLPATSDMVARYLVNYADSLSINTLKLRLAGLAQWHNDQGMPDPTKTPIVRKVLKGIRALHPAQEKQAKPLQLDQLEKVVAWLDEELSLAARIGNRQLILKYSRDRAIILVGFWKGFRSDELSRLDVDFMQLIPSEGLEFFLPFSKGDRESKGQIFKIPALLKLCPVEAVADWLEVSGISSGPLFRRVTRWGNLGEDSLHPSSFIPLLKSLFSLANVQDASEYSSHSLRRGFASWATDNNWDLKSLMQHVGWKDMRSAMRYLPVSDPFSDMRSKPLLVVPHDKS